MRTRNTTITGYFLRKRLKRQLVLRIWDMVRDVIMGRELARVWQPTRLCHYCQCSVEKRAVFCSACGTAQPPDLDLERQVWRSGPDLRVQETEELTLPLLPLPVPETDKLIRLRDISKGVETKRLYQVRIGKLRPIHQYLVVDPQSKLSQHKTGDAIRFLQQGSYKIGTVVQVHAPGQIMRGGTVHAMIYAVDTGEGFLTRVAPGEVVEK